MKIPDIHGETWAKTSNISCEKCFLTFLRPPMDKTEYLHGIAHLLSDCRTVHFSKSPEEKSCFVIISANSCLTAKRRQSLKLFHREWLHIFDKQWQSQKSKSVEMESSGRHEYCSCEPWRTIRTKSKSSFKSSTSNPPNTSNFVLFSLKTIPSSDYPFRSVAYPILRAQNEVRGRHTVTGSCCIAGYIMDGHVVLDPHRGRRHPWVYELGIHVDMKTTVNILKTAPMGTPHFWFKE